MSERDLHMLRETKPSGVYIELGNIANASDQQRIVSPANRQLLADWLLLGLIEYLAVRSVPAGRQMYDCNRLQLNFSYL